MSQSTRLLLNRTPSILNLYRRALFAKGLKGSTPKLPTKRITLANAQADAKKVSQYQNICGFKQNNSKLPMTYPHLLAFPLHLELMLLKDFPFAVMGMVHVRNEISQYRAIKPVEIMDVSCHFSDIRKTAKGFDVDIKTEVHITGELVWESISTNFVRKKTDVTAELKPHKSTSRTQYSDKEFLNLSSSLGRRYALISGDSNPIHLFSLSAKLFGFKGHIAHGMWSKARVIAALQEKLNSDACKVVIDFKLPIFLPTTIQLNYDQQGSTIDFDLRDQAGSKPHMTGQISAL